MFKAHIKCSFNSVSKNKKIQNDKLRLALVNKLNQEGENEGNQDLLESLNGLIHQHTCDCLVVLEIFNEYGCVRFHNYGECDFTFN